MPAKISPRRPKLVGAIAALLLLGTALPSNAFDPKVHDEIKFQVNCAILMLTDPDEHVRVCNPQPIPPGTESISTLRGGAPPPPPPEPEVTEEDDSCLGDYPGGCGAEYCEEEQEEEEEEAL